MKTYALLLVLLTLAAPLHAQYGMTKEEVQKKYGKVKMEAYIGDTILWTYEVGETKLNIGFPLNGNRVTSVNLHPVKASEVDDLLKINADDKEWKFVEETPQHAKFWQRSDGVIACFGPENSFSVSAPVKKEDIP